MDTNQESPVPKKTADIRQGPGGRFIPGNPGKPVGAKHKATAQAREAIGRCVDGNVERLQTWLDNIADGVPKPDAEGEYVIPPNPGRAFELFQSVVEYHIPKLARTEHTGEGGGPVRIVASNADETI